MAWIVSLRLLVGLSSLVFLGSVFFSHRHRRPSADTLIKRAGEHLPLDIPAEEPFLVVSLLIHEDVAWFKEWITIAHAALGDIRHLIVASVSPETYDNYSALNLPDVFFSAPTFKNKWGIDLLRGHVNNVRYAAMHFPNFTHAVLAASNNMWIRRVDPTWNGFALSTHGDCGCECHTPAVRNVTGWHWEKLSYDQTFWDFVDAKHRPVCMGQSEGFLATRQAWVTAIEYMESLLTHDILTVPGKTYADVAYPAEEIYLCTAFCANNLSKITVSRNFWRIPDMMPMPKHIAEARRDGMMLVKRVPRTPGNGIVESCVSGWLGTDV